MLKRNRLEEKRVYNAKNYLFEKQKILDEINKKGYFDIKSSVIKEYREPRLMTKFDHKVNLPQIFQKNKLSILPLTRGSYRIGHYDIFKEIKDINKKIKNFQIPNNIQSIDPKNLYSETSVLHSAYATGMLHDLFNIENNDFLIPTISGRMSSKNFEKLSESTIERRSQTVLKWIEWIVKQIYKND